MYHRGFIIKKKLNNSGFGLIELLVSLSILALVFSTIMVRQDSFNGAVLLRNQTYEIAMHIREIQFYAVSILGNSGDFNDSYGLYFNKTASNNTSYKVYRDTSDHYYSSTEEFGVQGKLDPRFEISDIRTVDNSGSESSIDDVSVTFVRPNFDARFFSSANTEIGGISALEIDVRLKGTSGTGLGKVRTIEITKTGQITIQSP